MDKYSNHRFFSDLTGRNKRHLFWILQTGGWLIYAPISSLFFIDPPLQSYHLLYYDMITYITGFIITLILRKINRRLWRKQIPFMYLIGYVFLVCFGLAFVWLVVDWIISYPFWTPERAIEKIHLAKIPYWVLGSTVFNSSILLLWSLFYFVINFWIEWSVQKKAAEKNKQLFDQARFIMLRYQLNPHFFFNSLNSIDALIDENKEQAKEMIYKLSDFIRYSFLSDNKPMVDLKDELKIIEKYFDIEKVRFEENIKVIYDIDQDSLNTQIPALILHPIVENAVKYGMKTSPMPLEIRIQSRLIKEGLNLRISNTGEWTGEMPDGENIKSSKGIGLKNVFNRLENAYGNGFDFNIGTGNEKVVVTINLKSSKIFQNDE